MIKSKLFFFLTALSFLAACSSSKSLRSDSYSPSSAEAGEVVSALPIYSESLHSLSGSGRALVSEPGNSNRVTILFNTNRDSSLLTIKNRIGIEGGKMLVSLDSILIYDRVEKVAQKISIYDGRVTSLNELASVNILDLVNFSVQAADVQQVKENEKSILLALHNGTRVFISKPDTLVREVLKPKGSPAPYSRIIYEGYGELEGYTFPRKITIFSSDGKSKVAFLVRSLEVNPKGLNLNIEIPSNVTIQRL